MTLTLEELNQAFEQLLTPAPASGADGAPEPHGASPAEGSAVVPTPSDAALAAPAPVPAAAATTTATATATATGPASRIVEGSTRGYHFDATVAPEQLVAAARLLDQRGFAIDAVTGVDWLAARQMELVYDFFHPLSAVHVVIRCRVARDGGEVPTISEVFPGANWHERETHDFFGVRFVGHPDLSPFLLPENADYHPLRKDFPGVA